VAHASLGRVFVFARTGECVAIVKSCAGVTCTNIAFGGPDRRRLFITESETGSVMVADMDVPGDVPGIPKR
jgi:gluconolactonase